MRWQLLPIVLLSLVLSACYVSKTMLLDPAAARQPWPSSTWSETHNGAVDNYRAVKRSDGWYDYGEQHADTGKWEEHKVLLNDLGTVSGRTLYAYAMQMEPGDEGQSVLYGIIVALPGGKWKAVTPDCSLDVPKAIARAHHVDEKNCMFSDRAQLLGALRDYAATPEFAQLVAAP
jgi:hypothetical protein